jgi:hypothetical protein
MDRDRIRRFWQWFKAASSRISSYEEGWFLEGIDERVSELDSAIAWEVGPGTVTPNRLALSPNLDRGLLPLTREIVRLAPRIADWEFLPSRPQKDWSPRFRLECDDGSELDVDASQWQFLLLVHPDGEREVVLVAESAEHVPASQRWTAAAIVLEGMVGEELLLERVDSFAMLTDIEERLRAQLRPLADLSSVLGTSSRKEDEHSAHE